MRRSRSPGLPIELLLLAVLVGAWSAAPAFAHKMVVFATGAGEAIEGEAYFHGGEPARDVKVTLLGPNDRVLGETTTDEEGRFRLAIRFRCDYRVIADAGAGHGAEYSVPADELSADLPPLDGSEAPPAKRPDGATEPPRAAEQPDVAPSENAAPGAVDDAASRRAEIEGLARQVTALRSDLRRYQNELRFRDVLGGLGYILGVMGTAFYFLGVRRKERQSAPRDP